MEVICDWICVLTSGDINVEVSAEDLLTYYGQECKMGWHGRLRTAWSSVASDSHVGCRPFEHHVKVTWPCALVTKSHTILQWKRQKTQEWQKHWKAHWPPHRCPQ